jgi:iron-sulfur cluster assembly protein
MTTATQVNTQLTPAAETFIRRFLRFAAESEAGFRLKVALGGCSGYATEFDLVGGPDAGDCVWEYEGLRIYLAAGSRKILDGATVDFVEDSSHTGLVIRTKGVAPAACGPLPKLVQIESLMRR